MVKKWPKIRVFGLFISFVWKWCRMKALMTLQHSAKAPHMGKIGSQGMVKNAFCQSDFNIL